MRLLLTSLLVASCYAINTADQNSCFPQQKPAGAASPGEANEGLIGFWRFDALREGRVDDESGSENPLFAVGQPQPEPGVCGGAFRFDGGQSYFTTRRPVIPEGDFAISLWVRANNWDKQFVLGQYRYEHKNRLNLVVRNGHARIQIGNIVQSPEPVFTQDRWYHVVYSRGGGWLKIYVDVKLVYEGRLDVGVIQDEPLEVGRISVPRPGFASDAALDELRIYNRPLSGAEVKWLYEQHRASGDASLLRKNRGQGQPVEGFHKPVKPCRICVGQWGRTV